MEEVKEQAVEANKASREGGGGGGGEGEGEEEEGEGEGGVQRLGTRAGGRHRTCQNRYVSA